MKEQRQPKLASLFSRLKHVIQADDGLGVRRRNLRSSREGDIQLELDFGDARGALSRLRWFQEAADTQPLPR